MPSTFSCRMFSAFAMKSTSRSDRKCHKEASRNARRLSDVIIRKQVVNLDALVQSRQVRARWERLGKTVRRLRGDVERHVGQMFSTFEVSSIKLDMLRSPDSSGLDVLSGKRVARPHFEAGLRKGRVNALLRFGRCHATERRVRPSFIVPLGEDGKLGSDPVELVGDEHAPNAFLFQCAKESFDDRNRPLLAHGAEALFDATSVEPSPQCRGWFLALGVVKLRAFVSDQVTRGTLRTRDRGVERRNDVLGGRFFPTHAKSEDLARTGIDDRDDFPAKRKESRKAGRPPADGQPPAGGNGGDVDVPNVPRVFRDDGAGRLGVVRGRERHIPRRPGSLHGLFERTPNRRSRKMKTSSREPSGHLPVPEQGKQGFELLHERRDEVGELVDRIAGRLQKRIVIELAVPTRDSDGAEEKLTRGARVTPAARLLHAKNRKATVRRVVRQGRGARGALGDDAKLLLKQSDLMFETFDMDLMFDKRLLGGMSPGADVDDGVVSEGESREQSAFDVFVPRLGQRDFWQVERFHEGRDTTGGSAREAPEHSTLQRVSITRRRGMRAFFSREDMYFLL